MRDPVTWLPKARASPIGAWHVFTSLVIVGTAAVLGVWLRGWRAEPEVFVQTTQMPLGPEPAARPRPTHQHEAMSAAAVSSTYALDVTVRPAQAELWLDGLRVGIGRLSMVLARDGQMHELYVTALDHHPQIFLFSDSSPPREVVLEPAP